MTLCSSTKGTLGDIPLYGMKQQEHMSSALFCTAAHAFLHLQCCNHPAAQPSNKAHLSTVAVHLRVQPVCSQVWQPCATRCSFEVLICRAVDAILAQPVAASVADVQSMRLDKASLLASADALLARSKISGGTSITDASHSCDMKLLLAA